VDIKSSRPSGERLRSRRNGPSIACLIAVASALFLGNARANLWGYLDEQGAAHFATEKLDERYQLFSKATNVDAAARAKAAAPPAGEDFSRRVCIST
jgi:hypothetical protein